MIGRSGERGLGIPVLAARNDDDDDDIVKDITNVQNIVSQIFVCACVCVWLLSRYTQVDKILTGSYLLYVHVDKVSYTKVLIRRLYVSFWFCRRV